MNFLLIIHTEHPHLFAIFVHGLDKVVIILIGMFQLIEGHFVIRSDNQNKTGWL